MVLAYVSAIQDISRSPVPMSGAGTSTPGPKNKDDFITFIYLSVTHSFSSFRCLRENLLLFYLGFHLFYIFTNESFLCQLQSKSASNSFQFMFTVLLGVDFYTSFSSSKRNINTGTLECHQGRERFHFISRHIFRKTNTWNSKPLKLS